MPHVKRPNTPLRHLVRLLWQPALWAIPFALFFGTIYGTGRWETYRDAYLLSAIMSYVISAMLWLTEHLVMPRALPLLPQNGPQARIALGLVYVVASMGGAFIAALIIRATILPQFMGGPRGLFVFGMYTLLFALLFSALSYAMGLYQQSIERARSDQELTLARRIQRSFLLSEFPAMPGIEMHAVNVSSKEVSGDFYDVVPAGEDSFLFAVADVSGKGFPAALLTSMLQASLRTQALTVPSVSQVLGNINQLVHRSASVSQFATFFLARMDGRDLRLHYSNAGHNFPVVYRRHRERVMLERGGTVIGILEHAAFEEDSIALEPGDRVLLYTDGINEAMNAANDMYGEDRIHALMESLPPTHSAQATVDALLTDVRAFLDGVEPGDDMTVMVLRVLDASASSPGA